MPRLTLEDAIGELETAVEFKHPALAEPILPRPVLRKLLNVVHLYQDARWLVQHAKVKDGSSASFTNVWNAIRKLFLKRASKL